MTFNFFLNAFGFEFSSQGSLSGYSQKWAIPENEFTQNRSTGLLLSGNLNFELGKNISSFIEGNGQSDSESNQPEDRQEILLKNFYFQYLVRMWQFRIGTQILTMAPTDIINPLDVIHPRNYRSPLSPESMGSEGISLNGDFGSMIATLFFIPKQKTHRWPSSTSLWWPREKRLPVETGFGDYGEIPVDIQYSIHSGEVVDNSLENNFMLRWQWLASQFEWTIQYYQGLSQDPRMFVTAQTTNFILESPVILTPFYYRHENWASSLVLPFKNFVLKMAGHLSQSLGSDPRTPKAESTWVASIEKNVEANWGLVTLIIQHSRIFKKDKNEVSFLRSVFENSWMLAARIPIGENHQILGGGVYDSLGKSSMLRLDYKYRIGDHWSWDVGIQSLQGPADTMIGLYEKYDSVSTKLNFIW